MSFIVIWLQFFLQTENRAKGRVGRVEACVAGLPLITRFSAGYPILRASMRISRSSADQF
jgi:hypothetical protein